MKHHLIKAVSVALLLFVINISISFAGGISSPPITEKRLSNGLEAVIIENHELPVVYMKLVIAAGSARDPGGKEGLANFTAGMLKRGTESRSTTEIAEQIDFVGGSININVDRDATYIAINLLVKHIDTGMELLSDIILNPKFDTGEIEKYRKQILNGIIASKENPNAVCAENFNKLLFGSHPYGHPARGISKSVSDISRDDLVDYYKTFIRPNNSFIVVSGDVNPGELIPKISRYFDEWNSRNIPVMMTTSPATPEGRNILLIDKPDATQTHVRFGAFGISRQSEIYYPFISEP